MHMSTLSSALGVMSAVKRRRPLYELILVISARSSVSPRRAAPRPAGPIPVVEEEIENDIKRPRHLSRIRVTKALPRFHQKASH